MSEIIFDHKHIEENRDIVEMHIRKVPRSKENHEGVSYWFVYIRSGVRLIGYDNFEGHAKKGRHHKHLKERIEPYEFVDE
jgi:hypothetical protein